MEKTNEPHIRVTGELSLEGRKKLADVLKEIDANDFDRATDTLIFTLLITSSRSILEALGKMEMFKSRLFELEKSPEAIKAIKEMVDKAKKKSRETTRYIG